VRALADVPRIGPGQTFRLAVIFDIEPKWHMYWKNPGEGSAPPRIAVEAPRGFRVGEPLWTRPAAFRTPLGVEYGYEKQAVLFVPVEAPAQLSVGRAVLNADIRWSVCKDVCILGSARRSVVVETAREAPPPGRIDPVVREHEKRLPKALAATPGASVAFDGTTLTVTGAAQSENTVAFFPGYCPGVTYHEAESAIEDGRFRVVVKVDVNPKNALGEPIVLSGLVVLGEKADDPCYDFELPLPTRSGQLNVGPPRSTRSQTSDSTWEL
jgi:thiol:disulfide interchange protein DsbD